MNKKVLFWVLLIIISIFFTAHEVLAGPTIIGNVSDTVIVEGGVITISATVSYSGGLSGAKINWGDGIENVNCDIPIGGVSCSINYNHTFNSLGTYRVMVGAGIPSDYTWHFIDSVQVIDNHCLNGFQDSDEEGIDCGGADCSPCAGTTIPSSTIPTQYDNPLSAEDIPQLVSQIVEYFSRILIYYLVPLLIIIGAYVIVTSGGSASKVNRGKKIVIWTLAGFAFILLARGLIALVQKLLGG